MSLTLPGEDRFTGHSEVDESGVEIGIIFSPQRHVTAAISRLQPRGTLDGRSGLVSTVRANKNVLECFVWQMRVLGGVLFET
jgi:hypothetical protein